MMRRSSRKRHRKYGRRYKVIKASLIGGNVVLLMLVAFFGTVLAENSPSERVFPKRFYVGIGGGITDLDPESTHSSLTVGDDRDTAFNVFIGYDLNRFFTVEGYYANLGEAGIRFLGTDVGTVDYQVAGVSGIGYLFNTRGADDYVGGYDDEGRYRREGLSGFLRLGLGAMKNSASPSGLSYDRDHTSHLSAGLGLEYGWSNGVAVRGELSSYDTDAHFLGLTLLKRFGDAPGYANSKTGAKTDGSETIEDSDNPQPLNTRDIGLSLLAEFTPSYFSFARYDLTDATIAKLDQVYSTMQANPSLFLAVGGHADSTGPESFNQTLSMNRAEAVRNYLVKKGIDESRISVQGYGETVPIASNDTREGRAQNRRVEVNLKQPD